MARTLPSDQRKMPERPGAATEALNKTWPESFSETKKANRVNVPPPGAGSPSETSRLNTSDPTYRPKVLEGKTPARNAISPLSLSEASKKLENVWPSGAGSPVPTIRLQRPSEDKYKPLPPLEFHATKTSWPRSFPPVSDTRVKTPPSGAGSPGRAIGLRASSNRPSPPGNVTAEKKTRLSVDRVSLPNHASDGALRVQIDATQMVGQRGGECHLTCVVDGRISGACKQISFRRRLQGTHHPGQAALRKQEHSKARHLGHAPQKCDLPRRVHGGRDHRQESVTLWS